jgi:hypothetical protein
VTRELGSGPLPEPIGALIDAEFETARATWLREAWRPEPATIAAANDLLRRWAARTT